MPAGRFVVLITSPRLPAGLLTAPAWDLVRAHPVLTAAESDQAHALRSAGAQVTIVGEGTVDAALDALGRHGTVVWLAGRDGDEEFVRAIGLRLIRQPGLAGLELQYGSWDPPGGRLLDVVTVMDRLASPGGDPWKREQTHQSLARYLLEEAYEAYDAIDAHDLDALREELGDVLLQVVLHSRMAEEADHPWTVDDLAAGLVAKLIRRNPHVFGDEQISDVDEIAANWERIKQAEKNRGSALDGIALAQPALALAAKILSRSQRAGLVVPVPAKPPEILTEDDLGATLLALVAAAQPLGLDAEAALRRVALALADRIRADESG